MIKPQTCSTCKIKKKQRELWELTHEQYLRLIILSWLLQHLVGGWGWEADNACYRHYYAQSNKSEKKAKEVLFAVFWKQ